MTAHRAIVIGSGIGGSAATLLLAHAGIPTTLVEKNRRLGGSCSGYEKQGFTIDIGTHMFCRGPKGPLGDVLRRVGEGAALEFRRTKDIAELRFPARRGGPKGRLAQARDGVVRIPVPADLVRIPRFAVDLARALGLSAREAARAARLFAHILTMSDEEVAALDDVTIEEFIAPYTDHPPTIGIFGFLLGLYFILPYWEVSAGEALYSFRKMALDNHLSYPVGGSQSIPRTYCRLAERFGAAVRTGVDVRRIVVDGGRARGVELEDGTFLPASIVVSTSSVRTTVLRLVGASHFPAAYVERAKAIRGSYIAVQAKIGLRKKLVAPGCLVGGVGETRDLLDIDTGDLRAMFDAVARGAIPEIVPFYCPVPSNFDEGLAPPGHQLLTVCAVAPTTDIALRDPSAAWEEAMLRTLRSVVPRLEDELLFVDRFSVDFIARWIGKDFGPAVSTGQMPGQVGKNRPPVYTPVAGLYMAGCGAGARGVGTELAAASAMECVDRILVDLGRDLRVAEPIPAAKRLSGLATRAALGPLAWATRARGERRALRALVA
jgi:prolycopene isomerase